MTRVRYFINAGLILSFSAMAVTGLIKFPGLMNSLGLVYVFSSISTLNFVHHLGGAIFILFVLLHLADNRHGLAALADAKLKLFKITIKAWHLAFFLLAALVIIGVCGPFDRSDEIKELQSVEIKEYMGEKLSSVVDLQDVSISGTQYVNLDDYRLEISGLVENPRQYTYQEVIGLPNYSKVVDINCVTGWDAKILWQGVLVKDLLAQAGVKSTAKIAIFYAQDGFTSSLPLDFLTDNNILLAHKINGVTLPPAKGFPFQLVAEQKWGYKWVKWLKKIEVSDDLNYRGTYESSGYNNNADVNGPIH
jgi:DMSO/TMAO reductase YedYZ molybdopterin-dependent catalytic subunit